ncbi:P-loop containing nucleoside triphosphate hydrolase protein [Apiospora arundinis]
MFVSCSPRRTHLFLMTRSCLGGGRAQQLSPTAQICLSLLLTSVCIPRLLRLFAAIAANFLASPAIRTRDEGLGHNTSSSAPLELLHRFNTTSPTPSSSILISSSPSFPDCLATAN